MFLRNLAIALGLGLLIGLQRERAAGQVAGIRTFALIAVLGTVAGTLADRFGGWLVVAGLLGVAAVLAMANRIRMEAGELDPGTTTEMAALMTFLVGAGLPAGYLTEAVVVGGGTAVLLQLKRPLHGFVERIGPDESRAIFRLVLLALVVLPLLPNHPLGPYGVLNPRQIWFMVVLIVGISLAAYVAYRLLGPRGGTLAAGLLGGLISSTATTVSQARREDGPGRAAAASVIVLASAAVFARILVEVAVVNASMLPAAAPPLLLMTGCMAGAAGWGYLRERGEMEATAAQREVPSQLRTALTFGLLYAVVLVAAAAARENFGTGGLYAVSALSGLTDVDAITISAAQLVGSDRIQAATGWRMIVLASMTNLVFKAGAVLALAGRDLFWPVARRFGVGLLGGSALLLLWPG